MNRYGYPKSKLLQAKLLNGSMTDCHLPETHLFNEQLLIQMLHRHKTVYVKPDGGGKGRGIIRIDNLPAKQFRIYYGKKVFGCHGNPRLKQVIKNMIPKKTIIQQGVPSLTLDKRHYLLRTHLQRVNQQWQVAGILAAVAPLKEYVANGHRGARSIRVEELFHKYLRLPPAQQNHVLAILKRSSIQIAQALAKKYPRQTEYGIDFGMDQDKKLWVYEANITPGIKSFAKLYPHQYQQIIKNRRATIRIERQSSSKPLGLPPKGVNKAPSVSQIETQKRKLHPTPYLLAPVTFTATDSNPSHFYRVEYQKLSPR
ncbi:YheC/YheD family protein [Marininema halotolerans]|uniref:YheC/D like ATP-grasp n=1 Tax=Marininema halotolerans TaxID=1155944 RepID=A0A1I6UUA2_9BACL|nr:YheC/YheD family protein [Marininema halotolerans]SFT05001.1 YheC/D like ATP-grasp [Marininema halotolerans]